MSDPDVTSGRRNLPDWSGGDLVHTIHNAPSSISSMVQTTIRISKNNVQGGEVRNSPQLNRRLLAGAGSMGKSYGAEMPSLDDGPTMEQILEINRKMENTPLTPLKEEDWATI